MLTSMSLGQYLVLFLTSAIGRYEAARILGVFPTPSISHQVAFRPLILELVNRGHEVIVMTPDPIFKNGEAPANLTEIDVHDISYKTWMDGLVNKQITKGSRSDLKEQVQAILDMMEKVFDKQLQTIEMQKIIMDNSRTFDLLILEAYASSSLGLSYIFKNVPVIQISSFGALTDSLYAIGAPIHPLIYPTCFQQKTNDLTIWDKIRELYHNYCVESTFEGYQERSTMFLRNMFGKDMPSIRQLERNVDLLLLNVHPLWEMNRPYPPNVIFMGGIHQKPHEELPQVRVYKHFIRQKYY